MVHSLGDSSFQLCAIILIVVNHEYPFLAIRCISELFLFLVPPKAIILEDSSFSAFSFHPQFFSIVVSSFVSRLSGVVFKFSSLRWLMISSFSCISINSWYPHSIVNSYRCFLQLCLKWCLSLCASSRFISSRISDMLNPLLVTNLT